LSPQVAPFAQVPAWHAVPSKKPPLFKQSKVSMQKPTWLVLPTQAALQSAKSWSTLVPEQSAPPPLTMQFSAPAVSCRTS
jgi:hypothetical protein